MLQPHTDHENQILGVQLPSRWIERRRYAAKYVRSRLRHLVSLVGREFFVFSLLMRLPSWMLALAVLLIMTSRTGEVTLGTYAAGTVALSSAMSHRSYRRLALQISQRVVLCVAATLNIPAVAFLLVQTLNFEKNRLGGSVLLLLLASAVAGFTTVPLGAMMRSYWSLRYTESKDRRMLNSASTFETLLDLIALPLAASLVGAIAIVGGINLPLYAVIVIDVVGILFILWRPNSIRIKSSVIQKLTDYASPSRTSLQLGWIPMLGISCLGVCLGSSQTMLVLRSVSQESVFTVGFYLGAMGGAGALICVLMIIMRARVSTWQVWMVLAVLLTFSALCLSIPSSSTMLLIVFTVFGAVLGASLLSMGTIVTSIAAHGNIDLAQSTLQATYIAGLALGYVWGGIFGSRFGTQSALLVPLIAATGFLILSHVYGYRWRLLYEEKLTPLAEELSIGKTNRAQRADHS